MYANELKNFVISDTSQKYEEINKKIIKFSKIYFTLSKNYSSQLSKNQNDNNDLNIKQLLDNQHYIIKELVKIINDILIEKINSEVVKKLEGQSFDISDEPLEQKSNTTNIGSLSNYSIDKPYYKQCNIKEKPFEPINVKNNINNNIINNMNNNKNSINNIIYNNKKSVKRLKKNLNKSVDENLIAKKLLNQKKIIPLNIITPRTDNEFSGALSFLNININNKVNNYKPKKFQNYKIEPSSTQRIIRPNSNIDATKNNSYIRTNNNNYNILSSHYMNNNYTIDEEKLDNNSGNNERQTSITSHNNLEDENFPEALNKRKQRIKYRMGNSLSGDKDNRNKSHLHLYNLNKIKTLNNLNSKVDYYLNTNSSFPNFSGSNSTERIISYPNHHIRSNTTFNFFKPNFNNLLNKDNKYTLKSSKSTLYSIPYINNGTVIKPSRFTKEIYNNSYQKITKYQKKRLHKSAK